jgi:hypothetical protein
MSTLHEDPQVLEAIVPVIMEVVPQEDVLTAFTCYAEPVLERAGDSLQAQVEDILPAG